MHSLIKLDVVSGVSFRGVATRLKELAHTQFYRKELVYYDFAARIKACEAARRGEPRGAAEEEGGCDALAWTPLHLPKPRANQPRHRLVPNLTATPWLPPPRPPPRQEPADARRLPRVRCCGGAHRAAELWRRERGRPLRRVATIPDRRVPRIHSARARVSTGAGSGQAARMHACMAPFCSMAFTCWHMKSHSRRPLRNAAGTWGCIWRRSAA